MESEFANFSVMMASRHARYDPSSRKKEEQEELLVFGYSCKLFRDDEKALYIDQGKHLIPWMGDDTLKIDRYDVRGTVADLRPLEPLPGGATEAQWSALSDSERKAEQLCDEERYRALYHNEAEEALYQEEELKRLHQALDSQHSYGQVGYNYDDANAAEQQSQDPTLTSADAEEEDRAFVAPPELDIPVGMVLPDKCKLNAIIEKTALFISTQGPQMEIILKTKQSNNPQFEFLSFDCPLHAYYRHLLMAIKTGRYRPQEQQPDKEQQESDADDSYLHPSLAPPPARVELAPSIPTINYKPSADCAYSMLVSKIKDKQLKSGDSNSGPSSPQPSVAFPSYSKRRKAGYPSSGSSTRSGSRTGTSSSSSGSSSDSEGNTNKNAPAFLMPPNDIQLIIDKMASYVLKNGRDFESVVRSKGDARFGFLDPSHEYHPYYEHKIRVYQGVEPPYVPSQAAPITRPRKKKKKKERTKSLLLPQYESSSSDSDSDVPRTASKKGKSSKAQAPVSFSIKKPKDTEILQEIRSALPLDLEESSDNEEDESKEKDEKKEKKDEKKEKKEEKKEKKEKKEEKKEKKEEKKEKKEEKKEKKEEKKEKKDEKKEKELSESKSSSRKDEKDSRRSRKDEKANSEDADYEKLREEELRKTRKLLKEKEMQLREKEREKEREIEKKRNEDIFPTPVVQKENIQKENTEEPKNLSDQLVDLMNSAHQDKKSPKEKQEKKLPKEKEDKIVDLDDDLITEAEIIDLTDEKVVVPKSKEISLKLERKRRAAAFLSRLKNDQKAPSNGTSKDGKGDSEVMSVPSPPSPPSPPRLTELNGSTIPKHSSLLARLAASNVVSKQPPSILVDRRHKRRKSETPKKRSRSRSSSPGRQSPRNKKHRKRKYDSPDRERTRSSRSRSRSVMSPTKVYQRRHRDHNQDHRYNSHYDYDREDVSSFRQKNFKHKIHKHFKHRRERHSTENEGDDDAVSSQKYKYKHRSKNGQSSDSSGE